MFRKRLTPVVPVLLGNSIPPRDGSPQQYQVWCRSMLTLFKPWRKPCDLRARAESWSSAFERTVFPSASRELMRNLNVFRECKDARDAYNEERRRNRTMPDLI
ncbi:hypothetical protein CALCODRAFT_440119, partial [Calocera cornea HHB12733]